jgi:hypothetical protein
MCPIHRLSVPQITPVLLELFSLVNFIQAPVPGTQHQQFWSPRVSHVVNLWADEVYVW